MQLNPSDLKDLTAGAFVIITLFLVYLTASKVVTPLVTSQNAAIISSYKDQVADLKRRVTDLEMENERLQSKLDAVETQLEALKVRRKR